MGYAPAKLFEAANTLPRDRNAGKQDVDGRERQAEATPSFGRLCPAMTVRKLQLRRGLLLRREAAGEVLPLGGHVDQKFRRGEARAVFGLQLVAQRDKVLR